MTTGVSKDYAERRHMALYDYKKLIASIDKRSISPIDQCPQKLPQDDECLYPIEVMDTRSWSNSINKISARIIHEHHSFYSRTPFRDSWDWLKAVAGAECLRNPHCLHFCQCHTILDWSTIRCTLTQTGKEDVWTYEIKYSYKPVKRERKYM